MKPLSELVKEWRGGPEDYIACADELDAWLGEAEKKVEQLRGCNCAAVDIGVGIQHEPTCGLADPKDFAMLLGTTQSSK